MDPFITVLNEFITAMEFLVSRKLLFALQKTATYTGFTGMRGIFAFNPSYTRYGTHHDDDLLVASRYRPDAGDVISRGRRLQ